MQEALTPRALGGRTRPGPGGAGLACATLGLLACGEVIDVGDRPLCGSAGYRMSLPVEMCDPARLQLCSYQGAGPSTRLEPLDCREGVGYLDDPGVTHHGCASALAGLSGQRCGAEFMCARHADDACCIEVAACSFAHSLLRSRVCLESCPSALPSPAAATLAIPQGSTCAQLAPLGTALIQNPSALVYCIGDFVCSETWADLTSTQPLAKGLTGAYFCVGGRVQHAHFLDYSFAPTVPSDAPVVLSSRKPDAAR